jgi:outer membrane protein assembly factor BamB
VRAGRSWSLVVLLIAVFWAAPAVVAAPVSWAIGSPRRSVTGPAESRRSVTGPGESRRSVTGPGESRRSVTGPGESWSQGGYGATDSGFDPGESRLLPGRLGQLARQWTVAATGTQVCASQSAPVTAGGRIFLTGRESLGAYAAKTGKTLWSFPYADPMDTATPRLAVAGSTVLAATWGCQSQSDPDGDLYALDAATGALRWKAHTDAPDVTLVVDRGVVVVGGEDASDDGTTAFDLVTGKKLWERSAAAATAGVSAAGTLLLTGADQNSSPQSTIAVDITTGKTRWRTDRTWSVLAADPSGKFFLVDDPAGALLEVDAGTGKVVWTHDGLPGPVAADTERAYVAGSTAVVALDLATGHTTWERNRGGTALRPVVAGGVVYVAAKAGRVAALAAATGRPLKLPMTAKSVDHAMLDDGWLYLTDGSTLTAYTIPE